MEYKIEVKDISPIRVIRTKRECLYTELRKTAKGLFTEEEKNIRDSLIALVHQPELHEKSLTTPCYPIENGTYSIDESRYEYDVLPRMKAISTLHYGEYDKLEKAFDALLVYLEKEKKQPVLPIRIIFRKSVKLKGLFKPKPVDFVTEIQVPFVDEDEV